MTIEISTNNLVSIDNRYVGRIHKDDAHPKHNRPVRFYAGKIGAFDQIHEIAAPLYVGGPSDWRISPEFEAAVRKVVNA